MSCFWNIYMYNNGIKGQHHICLCASVPNNQVTKGIIQQTPSSCQLLWSWHSWHQAVWNINRLHKEHILYASAHPVSTLSAIWSIFETNSSDSLSLLSFPTDPKWNTLQRQLCLTTYKQDRTSELFKTCICCVSIHTSQRTPGSGALGQSLLHEIFSRLISEI